VICRGSAFEYEIFFYRGSAFFEDGSPVFKTVQLFLKTVHPSSKKAEQAFIRVNIVSVD
jgi:hypothetical protein